MSNFLVPLPVQPAEMQARMAHQFFTGAVQRGCLLIKFAPPNVFVPLPLFRTPRVMPVTPESYNDLVAAAMLAGAYSVSLVIGITEIIVCQKRAVQR